MKNVFEDNVTPDGSVSDSAPLKRSQSTLITTWWPAAVWVVNLNSSMLMDEIWTEVESRSTSQINGLKVVSVISRIRYHLGVNLFSKNGAKDHDWQLRLTPDWSSTWISRTLHLRLVVCLLPSTDEGDGLFGGGGGGGVLVHAGLDRCAVCVCQGPKDLVMAPAVSSFPPRGLWTSSEDVFQCAPPPSGTPDMLLCWPCPSNAGWLDWGERHLLIGRETWCTELLLSRVQPRWSTEVLPAPIVELVQLIVSHNASWVVYNRWSLAEEHLPWCIALATEKQ